MTTMEAVTITVTQEHIDKATTRKDPVVLAALAAIPEAVDAEDWYSDAELREMCVTVWLNTETDDRFTLAFTFPPDAFNFIDDFIDGKHVSPFTVTARRTP
jgi:hypothetical protein